LQYIEKQKGPFRRSCAPKEEPRYGIMVSKENIERKPEYQPKPRKPRLGYTSELTIMAVMRKSVHAPAIVIQRIWRGYHSRLFVKEIYRAVRHRRIKRWRAADRIKLWYRACRKMKDAMDILLELKYEKKCIKTIQRVWRGHRGRRRFWEKYGRKVVLRKKGALVAQRIVRGFLARTLCRRKRDKVFRFRMAARIGSFFLRARRDLVFIREKIFRKKTAAAIIVQKYTRRLLGNR
jgi:hypothetical protein